MKMDMRGVRLGVIGLSILAMAAGLSGCGGGGGEDKTSIASQIVVNTPASIAQVSADDYDDNVNGLISAATLKRWKDDWVNQRPAGVTGKLVILQVTAGPAGSEYIKPNGTNVFTYLSPSSEWLQTRSNGVIETQSMVPDGATMDALLKKYNIDPSRDMIVAAMGAGSGSNAMGQGRIWYALRYWGVDRKNLAVLNGGNQWLNGNGLGAGDFQATASAAPNNGIFSVKSLKVDNTQLQATVQDMMAILPGTDANVKTDGVFIWDARSLGQYAAGQQRENGDAGCALAYCAPVDPNNYIWSFQNNGSRQGHPRGAMQLQYTHLLDSAKGYAYRSKAELTALLNGEANAAGIGFVDGSFVPVGSGNAYQPGDTIYTYCETTLRAMVTGIASAVILGKPTRFYDGAMVEWNSLSHLRDSNGSYILPANSPWRTDVVSFFKAAENAAPPGTVAPRTIVNPYASNTNAIVNADKAYKTGESSGGGSGGGGAPSNPCGG